MKTQGNLQVGNLLFLCFVHNDFHQAPFLGFFFVNPSWENLQVVILSLCLFFWRRFSLKRLLKRDQIYCASFLPFSWANLCSRTLWPSMGLANAQKKDTRPRGQSRWTGGFL